MRARARAHTSGTDRNPTLVSGTKRQRTSRRRVLSVLSQRSLAPITNPGEKMKASRVGGACRPTRYNLPSIPRQSRSVSVFLHDVARNDNDDEDEDEDEDEDDIALSPALDFPMGVFSEHHKFAYLLPLLSPPFRSPRSFFRRDRRDVNDSHAERATV